MSTTSKILFLCIGFSITIPFVSCIPEEDGGVYNPQAVFNSNTNQYLVVYERQPFDNRDIRSIVGKIIDANGSAISPEFAISGIISPVRGWNSVCKTALHDTLSHRYFVAWTVEDRIYGQFVNENGSLFDAVIQIADTPSCPVIALDTLHWMFLITWLDASASSIVAQTFDFNGTAVGLRTTLTTSVSSDTDGPVAVAFAPDAGRFLVVARFYTTFSVIPVSADGTLAGNAVSLTTSATQWDDADVVYDGMNGRYLVSWSERSRLRGQFVNPDGSLLGASFPLSGDNGGEEHALAFDPADQRYLFVYGDAQIYGQVFNADGSLVTASLDMPVSISPAGYSGAYGPSVAFNTLQRQFFVVWGLQTSDARFPDIFGQLVNANGSPDGDMFLVASGAP